jgi:hypothetical protein
VYALIVAISTSNSYVIASANPVLTIVAGTPAATAAAIFLRVGLPLTVLMLIATLISVNLVLSQRRLEEQTANTCRFGQAMQPAA